MLKTRIILVVACAIIIWLIFLLPKAVVENESQLATESNPSATSSENPSTPHASASEDILKSIKELRAKYVSNSPNQKNTIFADSLVGLYTRAGQFDSAAWFAEEAATFFNTQESFMKAGNSYYEAYTFAMEAEKRDFLAKKTRDFLGKVLAQKYRYLTFCYNVFMFGIILAVLLFAAAFVNGAGVPAKIAEISAPVGEKDSSGRI